MVASGDKMILVEHGPGGAPALFARPREVIALRDPADLAEVLARLDAARAEGLWVAGWIAYEAGLVSEPRLGSGLLRGGGPLMVMGLFDGPEAADAMLERARNEGLATAMSPPEPVISRPDYDRMMARVLDYIGAGDCYQVNLTFPMRSDLMRGTALGLFGAMRRTGAVNHGAYADLGVGPVIVSRSPELFFQLDPQGGITARPMKGTAPRDADAGKDAELARALQASVKDRAENLMIVDLLRNDISRLARVGSVRVPELFAIEHYTNVHQMTSTVVGSLIERASLQALVPALFPCGSVTGAPKIRAMEIIAELEQAPRGVYCGAVGWMAPDGSADFSVAIRTLAVEGRRITLNVGGGVVADSTADGEWEEALWKARFVQAAVTRS